MYEMTLKVIHQLVGNIWNFKIGPGERFPANEMTFKGH